MVKRKILHSMFCGMAVIALGICIIMGALFPAGRDPFVPWSSAVAAQGRNLFCMMELNEACRKAGEKWCNPQMCSNSMEFITGVLNLIGTEAQYECVTNVGVAWWNVAVDVPEGCDGLFPVLISSNFDPKALEHNSGDNETLPIGRSEPLKDKGIVVVRKCGIAHIIKAKHCTRNVVVGNSVARNCQITYLTPKGRVDVNMDFMPNGKLLSRRNVTMSE